MNDGLVAVVLNNIHPSIQDVQGGPIVGGGEGEICCVWGLGVVSN